MDGLVRGECMLGRMGYWLASSRLASVVMTAVNQVKFSQPVPFLEKNRDSYWL